MHSRILALLASTLLLLAVACTGGDDDYFGQGTGGTPGAGATGGAPSGGGPMGGLGGSLVCGAGQAPCNGACVDIQNNPANCGNCGVACPLGQLCQAGVCGCAAGQLLCAGTCIDPLTSPTHCGTCGTACAARQDCVGGQCTCQAGTTACPTGCVDLATTATDCGACGNVCPASAPFCSQGLCAASCAAGLTSCGTSCVDIQTDEANCGTCGRACAAGQTCALGQCNCATAGQLDCGAGCVDTLSNPANCGQCGIVCAGGQTCTNGLCSCPAGQINCGGTCVTGTTCPCSPACGAGQVCEAGTCVCVAGTTACNGTCVDLASDAANCGGCGIACTGGKTCTNGACACPVGQESCEGTCVPAGTCTTACNPACTGGKDCVGGTCQCPAGQTDCSGTCADLAVSAANCGACGVPCAAPRSCAGGACGCPAGQEDCGGTCVTEGTCCEPACPEGQICTGGTCACPSGQVLCDGACVTGTSCSPDGCNVPLGMISNFEQGPGDPVVIAQDSRVGSWERFWDETKPGSFTSTVEASGNSGECDRYALHAKGSAGDWGDWVGVGIYFGTDKTRPVAYNASKYTGVRFKAKKGSGHDQHSAVRFNISIPETEGTGSGGTCDAATLGATTEKAARDCYQHLGRFLQVESGIDAENELTTEWKEFTYCFDRDLYPLSLPSNLTNQQRNQLPSKILKLQFQFNKGKDWYRGFVAESNYQDMAANLAFDFWINDLEFIEGDCPNTSTFQSSSGTAKPFPQNANIGSCTPATAGAGTAAAFNGAISRIYATWTRNFVRTDGNNLKVIAPEQENGVTTSEAMGYGMLIAAAMGDKTAFDKFWGYVQGKLSNGLMTWKDGQTGSATDGDVDIAYALLMAGAQWGGSYASSAATMISAIKSQDVSGTRLKAGSNWDPGFNPSYFAPSYFREFGGMDAVTTACYSLLTTNVNAQTGRFPTDWTDASGGPVTGQSLGAQVTAGFTVPVFGYDAARVPWRIGLDACGGNATARDLVNSIVQYFAGKYDQGASIDLLKAGWVKSTGNPAGSGDGAVAKDFQGSFIGPMGVGAMGATVTSAPTVRDRAFRTMLDVLESPDFNTTYFPSTVGFITLLIMSGNFPTP